MKKDSAFTGLEAAIVLIAFVVVAAVFSYVMLGAGFFATQKSQEVTYAGMKQSTSNIILDGQLYGSMNAGGTSMTALTFYIKVPEAGETQDLKYVTYLWTKENLEVQELASTGITPDTGKLNPGGRKKVTLTVPNGNLPGAGERFTLEIKPKTGAATLISRTLADGYNGGIII
ncbi:MAG: flagellin [Methanospirillum sp.]|uniref:flagellin n=1 Tax=Methanospirillum sp. TaxID=45200 RepID=UPI00237158BF|nr:flagellin [Methanospirillum sp.]MDD1728825.1 flagellin [Methanospirillum sp.]